MPEIVRAGLIQQRWTGDKDSMIANAVSAIGTAASQGAQVVCLQELFYGPYFCQVQDADYYSYTEGIPDGPTTQLMCEVAEQHGVVLVVPMYEQEHPGVYYNTAAVIDADGTYLGKHRKNHIPQVKGFWEKFYFRPGNLGYPVFDTAVGRIGVYICYERHFPEGWRALGLGGREDRVQPVGDQPRASRSTCGASSRPRRRWPTSTSSARSTGSASSRWATTTSTARPTSPTRAASCIGEAASDTEEEIVVRDLDMDLLDEVRDLWAFYRDRRPGHLRLADQAVGAIRQCAHSFATARWSTRPAPSPPTCWSTASRSPPWRRRACSTEADTVIEAAGKYVLPGGIDAHTHMEMPFGGTFSQDTFSTGTAAAAWGGTTTIIDFAVQAKGTSLLSTLDKWHEKADGNCAVDYGFHMIVSDVNDESLKEMESCIDAGVNSFKMFMAYPGVFYATDGEILRAMQKATETGSMVMMHAENGIAIDQLVAQALADGRTDPVHHGLTRPPELEGEATSRAITLAKVTGAPLYIVHLSAREALAAVAEARNTGQNVFAETCPQYLFLSIEDMAKPDFEGAKYVASPPLRPKDHQDDLWRGLRTNDLSVVSTDHCPFCFVEQKEMGRGDFSKIPNGMPGVEHRMDLLHQGVVGGKMSLARWVEVSSTTPARMFGLYPRKGDHRAGRGRRHRGLRPGRGADPVRDHAPHERGLLGVRGHASSPARSRRCSRAAPW